MDDELRAYLDERLRALQDELRAHQDQQRAYFEKQFSRIDDQFRDVEQRLSDKIEATETRLLTEFHKWARTYEIRARAVSTQTRFFEERLDAIEDRVANLEKKR